MSSQATRHGLVTGTEAEVMAEVNRHCAAGARIVSVYGWSYFYPPSHNSRDFCSVDKLGNTSEKRLAVVLEWPREAQDE